MAMSFPIPLAAPVMMATLSLRRMGLSLLLALGPDSYEYLAEAERM
jgi:hypothetical protein